MYQIDRIVTPLSSSSASFPNCARPFSPWKHQTTGNNRALLMAFFFAFHLPYRLNHPWNQCQQNWQLLRRSFTLDKPPLCIWMPLISLWSLSFQTDSTKPKLRDKALYISYTEMEAWSCRCHSLFGGGQNLAVFGRSSSAAFKPTFLCNQEELDQVGNVLFVQIM